MEKHEIVLSDVHIQTDIGSKRNTDIGSSSYECYCTLFSIVQDEKRCFIPKFDEDGDPIIERKGHQLNHHQVIKIDHALATTLKDVGLQIWNGCMLLCDFIIHKKEMFEESNVLELGSGLGLVSIVISMFSKRVLCTDVGIDVLNLAKANIKQNESFINRGKECNIHVEELNWLKMDESLVKFSSENLKSLDETNFILAADVVYDNDLTDGLLQTIYQLMLKQPKINTFISVEKRLTFSLSSLEVACAAYDYFVKCLKELDEFETNEGYFFHVEKIPTNYPQYLNYQRLQQLELWQIYLELGE